MLVPAEVEVEVEVDVATDVVPGASVPAGAVTGGVAFRVKELLGPGWTGIWAGGDVMSLCRVVRFGGVMLCD